MRALRPLLVHATLLAAGATAPHNAPNAARSSLRVCPLPLARPLVPRAANAQVAGLRQRCDARSRQSGACGAIPAACASASRQGKARRVPTAQSLPPAPDSGVPGADASFAARREVCFTLEGDIFARYQSFPVGRRGSNRGGHTQARQQLLRPGLRPTALGGEESVQGSLATSIRPALLCRRRRRRLPRRCPPRCPPKSTLARCTRWTRGRGPSTPKVGAGACSARHGSCPCRQRGCGGRGPTAPPAKRAPWRPLTGCAAAAAPRLPPCAARAGV